MIYLVSKNQELFDNQDYVVIPPTIALDLLNKQNTLQFDTETTGIDPHIDKLLTMQFGTWDKQVQIVIDCTTINPIAFKQPLEEKCIIGHNLKFDLQFLYNYKIIPTKVYDTMIVEQLLYLGYPNSVISYALKTLADKYVHYDMDKTVRGQIIWRGLDTAVIKYAAGDVVPLNDIMKAQMLVVNELGMLEAAKLECNFVRVIAYLEWCGIHLSEERWLNKMKSDKQNLINAEKELNNFVVKTPSLSKYITYDLQGDLFEGFNTDPIIKINWASSKQVCEVAKKLGFNTQVKDKKTGEDKESVLEKHLKTQKGVNDEFLKLYFAYQEYFKVTTSFGQGHLDAINPITGRIHTVYRQLGAASGRMSCGSQQPNESLAKLKKISKKDCTYPNIQQLPHDETTRACFTAEKGNKLIDCDWSAAEARLAGDIYQDEAILDMFRRGLDSHSVYAKIFFKEELKDIDVSEVKKKRPDLRQLAKGPEFALNFGGSEFAIMQAIQCSEDKAKEIVTNYNEGFKGTAEFAKRGSKFVRENGYIVMCKATGHRMNWYDHDEWLERQKSFSPEFWEDYKENHKGTGDYICKEVSTHFKAASKWDRMARNAPTQGTCAVMLKASQIKLFDWVVNNLYFGKIKLCALVHDECLWETPEDKAEEFAKLIEKSMTETAAEYCKSLPIPAEAEIADCWKH